MRWSDVPRRPAAAALIAALLLSLLLASFGADEKQLTIFGEHTTYSVPVLDRGGEYVGLVEVLEPLCGVSAFLEKKKWRLRCDGIDTEFKLDGSEAKISGKRVQFAGPLIIDR